MLSTRLIAASLPTVQSHFNEVQSTAESCWQAGYINIERKFTVVELENLVVCVLICQIQAGASLHAALTRWRGFDLDTTGNRSNTIVVQITLCPDTSKYT